MSDFLDTQLKIALASLEFSSQRGELVVNNNFSFL